MVFFARAVVTGFGLAMGGALFRKVAPRLGLDDKDKKADAEVNAQKAATDPELDD
jgi:hypothetical protein